MLKKLLLIINPVAGKGEYRANLPEALQLADEAGYETTVRFTKGKGDAVSIAEENGDKYDIAACIGGDGTLSEMLEGLMKLPEEKRPEVGYIPMGTANDIATNLGLPKNNAKEGMKVIIEGTPHPFDVGGFGDKEHFAYIAAFGAFTEVSYATPQNQKKALGHLAYVLQGAAELTNIETYHTRVEFDDGVIETDLVYGSMSNSTSVAGIVKLKEEMVSLGDGMSELVLVKDPGSIDGFADIVSSVLSQRFNSDKLIILHTKKAKFTFEKPVAWTRDGEAGGLHTEIELKNYPHPVRMIF